MAIDAQQLLQQVQAPTKLRYTLIVTLSYLLVALVMLSATVWEMTRLSAHIEDLARERAHMLLSQFELMRSWTRQQHPQQPEPAADAVARGIANFSTASSGVHYRLISRHAEQGPTDIALSADAWESKNLAHLDEEPEFLSLIKTPGQADVHRYLARLSDSDLVLSLIMPADKLMAIRNERLITALLLSLAGFILIGGLAHLTARRTYRSFIKLSQLSNRQQLLIEERTADLSLANTLLAAEVEERTLNQERLVASEARYRKVVDNIREAIALVEEGRLIFANPRLAELTRLPLDSLRGHAWLELFAQADHEAIQACLNERLQTMSDGSSQPHTPLRAHLLCHGAGKSDPLVIELQVLPLQASSDRPQQWLLSARNISRRFESERSQRLITAVFESTLEAIMVTDRENRITMVNPAFEHITGYRLDEALGKSPAMLSSGRHDQQFYLDMWQTLQNSGIWSGEVWNRRKDGSLYIEWLTITALHPRDEYGTPVESEAGYVALFSDITQRKEAENKLRYKAHHDALTGLPNRSLFDDHLQLSLSQARRYGRNFALLYIDLDYFKKVNDTLGHAAGDELLIECAYRMSQCSRESDTLSRLGGDEFALLLSEISGREEIEDIASRIVAAVALPFNLTQGIGNISASIGIAVYPEHGQDADTLKANADLALYEVKRRSRNAYQFYSAELAGLESSRT